LLGVVYALLQGFCLGAISAAFDGQTDGIVAAAILSTVGVFIVALLLYVARIVKPTQKLAFGVIVGLGRLSLLYLFVWVLSIFNWGSLYSDHFRTVGIIVTLIAVVLAALSLTLDFGFIEACAEGDAPKVHGVVRRLRSHGDHHLAVYLTVASSRTVGAQPVGAAGRGAGRGAPCYLPSTDRKVRLRCRREANGVRDFHEYVSPEALARRAGTN
jgi:hypothetical protein